jgi:two-component system sensor histidine kinase/response regulator
VISDLHLPRLDGIALARIVRKSGGPQPRFILITGSTSSFDATITSDLDVQILRKPLKPGNLFSVVFGRADSAAPVRAGAPALPAALPGARRRVLVVDDSVVNQDVTLRQLKKLGHAADAVSDGIEALEVLGRSSYDLVLMDCQMPAMDGYDATRELRRRQTPMRTVPVVALTASAWERDRERCLAAGMNDMVTKPIREHQLRDLLAKWLPPEIEDRHEPGKHETN